MKWDARLTEIAVTCVVIIFTALISYWINKTGLWYFIVTFIILIAVYFAILFLAMRRCNSNCETKIQSINTSLNALMNSSQLIVYDDQGLVTFEMNSNYKKIWLITQDFIDDVPGCMYHEVVKHNIAKGCVYTYITSKSFRNEARIEAIKKSFKDKSGQIVFRYINDDFYFLTSKLDFCIYDPFNEDGNRCCLMGLPTKDSKRYYVSIDDELIDILVGKIEGVK